MHPLPPDAPVWRPGLRIFLLALASALAVLAGGCGPGVGGTGTGASEGSLEYFGASSAPLCSSELANLLLCPSSPGASGPGPTTGTGVRYFADRSTAPRVHLRVEGQRAELDAPCARLQFSGEWGQVPGRAGRFYGGAVVAAMPLPASLTAVPSGNGVAVELLDGDDHTLQATLVLVPVPMPQAVSCQ